MSTLFHLVHHCTALNRSLYTSPKIVQYSVLYTRKQFPCTEQNISHGILNLTLVKAVTRVTERWKTQLTRDLFLVILLDNEQTDSLVYCKEWLTKDCKIVIVVVLKCYINVAYVKFLNLCITMCHNIYFTDWDFGQVQLPVALTARTSIFIGPCSNS